MKTLPQTFKKYGDVFELHTRCSYKAIYTRTGGGGLKSYEVFKITRRGERKIQNKVLPASEKYPSDEMFGVSAWFCTSLEGAMKRYNEIEEPKLVAKNT